MTFVRTVDEAEGEALLGKHYAAERERKGYIPNYLSLFALRPEVYEAWGALIGAIRSNMDLRRYELVTLAAAQELSSSYCSLAHGLVLREKFFTESELERATEGAADEAADRAIMQLARQVIRDATRVDASDIESLRGFGLGDQEIFDVILAAAARAFFSKTLDAAGTAPDEEYRELLGPALAERLAVGRPIESR